MKSIFKTSAFAMVLATTTSAAMSASADEDVEAKLSGTQEVPAVQTMAKGTAHFTVEDDMTIKGSVKTEGIKATAAHIHDGAMGQNGGVVVPLTATGTNEWSTPKDAKLTPAQLDKLKAGNLYVNVHSDAHKDGEIRGQLKDD